MKAVIFPELHQAIVTNVERPAPSEEEALIRVGAAGICHTDIDILHGHYPARFPLTAGHEFAGVVEAVGRNADESLVGKRVAADPLLPCNLCSPCRARRFNKCESDFPMFLRRIGEPDTLKVQVHFQTVN